MTQKRKCCWLISHGEMEVVLISHDETKAEICDMTKAAEDLLLL